MTSYLELMNNTEKLPKANKELQPVTAPTRICRFSGLMKFVLYIKFSTGRKIRASKSPTSCSCKTDPHPLSFALVILPLPFLRQYPCIL